MVSRRRGNSAASRSRSRRVGGFVGGLGRLVRAAWLCCPGRRPDRKRFCKTRPGCNLGDQNSGGRKGVHRWGRRDGRAARRIDGGRIRPDRAARRGARSACDGSCAEAHPGRHTRWICVRDRGAIRARMPRLVLAERFRHGKHDGGVVRRPACVTGRLTDCRISARVSKTGDIATTRRRETAPQLNRNEPFAELRSGYRLRCSFQARTAKVSRIM
jgi:hypothetical protein